MSKSNQQITFKGKPIAVSGHEVKEGSVVPDFTLTAKDMSDLTINTFKGKTVVISVVPSLDTPVCSRQTKRFNDEAGKLSSDVVILTVSRDLPMAQARWCGAEGADKVVVASDYKYRTFGQAFGVDLESLGLLARSVFIVDKNGKIAYADYVPEVAEEPNYDEVLAKLKQLS